jgi:hypothetical protein
MLAFTQTELLEHENVIVKAERARIAALIRQKAEEHPQWDAYHLLNDLATSIDPLPADPQV